MPRMAKSSGLEFKDEAELEIHCCKLAFSVFNLLSLKQDTKKGLPDQLFFGTRKNKKIVFFVEFKDLGEKPKKYQTHIHKQIKRSGVNVYVVDNEEDFYKACHAEFHS